jgi:excisionase family DNA binding protein
MKTTDLISVAEAADIAGCTKKTICQKLRGGDLEGVKVGVRVWLVSRSAATKLAATISNRSLRKRAEKAAAKPKPRRSARAK